MLRFLNDYYARLSIILLVGYSVFIASNLFSLESENKWLLHTLEVKQAIEKSLGSLRDIETGARGYQITGEDSFLEPYNSGLTSLPNQLDYLQKLIADNKSQVAMIPRLRQQSKDKIEVARALIKAKGSSDLDMAIRYVHEGKTRMDSIRVTCQTMQDEEDRLQRIRFDRVNASYRMMLISTFVFDIFITMFIAVFASKKDAFSILNERSSYDRSRID